MQLAASCCELHFDRCCAVKRTGIFASESKVMCLSDFKKWCFPNINQCVKNLVEFIKRINLINVLFIGFVKQWFSAYQDQFGVWFFLARLRTAREFFLSHFLREKRLYLSFSCKTMFVVPVQCLDNTCFAFIVCPITQNIILILNTFRYFKTQKEKRCNDDVNRASVL